MQEVQRFNKVLKSLVLLGRPYFAESAFYGDLICLWVLVFGVFIAVLFFQGMTLITLCYLLCNMHSGVILHRPVVRPEQIMVRVLRNMVPFVFFRFVCYLFFIFIFSFPLFRIVLCRFNNCYCQLSFNISSLLKLYRKKRKCP